MEGKLRQTRFSELTSDIHAELDRLTGGIKSISDKIEVTLTPDRPLMENRLAAKNELIPVLSEFEAGMKTIACRVNALTLQVEDLICRCSL